MLFTNKQKINIPSINKIILWYFRIFGLTFGGFTFNKSEEFIVNTKLKIFGHIYTILIIVSLNILFLTDRKYDHLDSIYNSGYKLIYYLIFISSQFERFMVCFNFGYIQLRGFELFKVLFSYPIKTLKNKIIISILLGIAIAVQISLLSISLNSVKNHFNFKIISIMIFLQICYTISLSVIPLTTWGKYNTIFPKNLLQLNRNLFCFLNSFQYLK
jgi:hypothetical protein